MNAERLKFTVSYPISICLLSNKGVGKVLISESVDNIYWFCSPSVHSLLWLVVDLDFTLGNLLCAMWSWMRSI